MGKCQWKISINFRKFGLRRLKWERYRIQRSYDMRKSHLIPSSTLRQNPTTSSYAWFRANKDKKSWNIICRVFSHDLLYNFMRIVSYVSTIKGWNFDTISMRYICGTQDDSDNVDPAHMRNLSFTSSTYLQIFMIKYFTYVV